MKLRLFRTSDTAGRLLFTTTIFQKACSVPALRTERAFVRFHGAV